MRDLGTQLRAYYDRIQRPTDPDEIVAGKLGHDMTDEVRASTPWWRRPAFAVGAAAMSTLIIVAGAFMLTGDTDADVVAIVTTTTTAPEVTTTVPPTVTTTEAPTTTRSDDSQSREIVPPNLTMTWTRIDADVFEDAWITAITEGGPGLVAVGYVLEEPWPADWHSDGAVWVSSDGTEWERAASPADFSDSGETVGSDEFLIDVVTTPDGLAALGWIEGYGYARFESANGLDWTLTDAVDPENGLDRSLDVSSLAPAEVYAVVPFGDGFVAVGRSEPNDPTGMIWTSTDGQTWERIAEEISAPIRQFESVSIDPTGSTLLAFGWDRGLASFTTLISFDGVTWSEVGTMFGQIAPSSSAAYDEGRLVIVGLEWGSTAGVHVSDDGGATMYRLDDTGPAFVGDMSDIVLFGDTFIAVGGDRGFPQQGQIWGGDPMLGSEGRGAVWIGTWNA